MTKKIFLILFMLAASLQLSAKIIPGKVHFVHGDKKEDAPFALIYWLEKNNVIEADETGKFTFTLTKDMKKVTLMAAYVGYGTDTLVVDENTEFMEMNLYPDNELEASLVVGRQEGNYLSKLSSIRTEVISAAGLCKMACCNLAESFENSASVTVGYSDAVSGARQIRLLGLSGIYTTMLDENRPVMRGLASPFGLSYIPGQWLESIQIAKGPASVVNGIDAITGQINMEHRKPTDQKPLFINLFLSSMLRTEANVASSLQVNDEWSTVLLGHFSTDPMSHDANKDGFRDEPNSMQFNFSNRWLYTNSDNGVQVRFGVRALHDDRIAGQMDFQKGMSSNWDEDKGDVIWGSRIKNQGLNAYFKVGIPIHTGEQTSFAVVGDYSYHRMNSFFGMKDYNGYQNMGFMNIMYQSKVNASHSYIVGVSSTYENINETLKDFWVSKNNPNEKIWDNLGREDVQVGVYGEYTYTLDEKLTAIGGLRLDYNNKYGLMFAPRLNVKYSIIDDLVLRVTGGRAFRTPNLIADNLGVLSTGSQLVFDENLGIEDAWTYGANLTAYFKIGYGEDAYVSFDYFRTDFNRQIIVDQEAGHPQGQILFYNLQSVDGPSYTNSYQIDFSMEPVERFTVMATFRYTDAKITLKGRGLVDRPLMSKFKGVLNLQYATRMNKWTFDLTAQVNGPSRLPYFVENDENAYSPVYPLLFAQITRKFKGWDVYVGAENILNYKQKNPIIDYETPYSQDFNATAIWGPLMGIKVYAGFRFTLWK